MATMNSFDLLGGADVEDPSQLIVAQPQKIESKKDSAPSSRAAQQQVKQPAYLPSKPIPPAQFVREARNESIRGGSRGGGRGYNRGRGGGGFNRDSANNENSVGVGVISSSQGATEEGVTEKSYERRGGYGGPRGPFRGGRRGGFNNEEVGDGARQRRPFDRRSGTGRGNEFKREGAGRGNWGTQTDEIAQVTEEAGEEAEKTVDAEKPTGEQDAVDSSKENPSNEPEEKEPENKEMTLEEYEKLMEEKKKALQALKIEERKVDTKEFESMQQLANKKRADDVFIKVGSDKDKRKELADKEEKAKKSVSINEFLKPAEGYYSPGGRGRGRGRGSRGGYSGAGAISSEEEAPKIEDHGQFPTLGGK